MATGNNRYIDHLADFLYAYNHSVHSTTNMAPSTVDPDDTINLDKIWNKAFKPNRNTHGIKPKFHVGDKVLVALSKAVIGKEYKGTYNNFEYVISKVQDFNLPISYKLQEANTGNNVLGRFYAEELQKINDQRVLV